LIFFGFFFIIHFHLLSYVTLEKSGKDQEARRVGYLHFATYASHHGKDDRLCRMLESALRSDVRLNVLGWGRKWTGLSQKIVAAYWFASSLPSNDVIMFTDAFDSMFVSGNVEKIKNDFISLDADVVFAAECGCWPHIVINATICHDHRVGYPKSPTSQRYLNSGSWIGYAGKVKEMLAAVIEMAGTRLDNANDQELLANMFLSRRMDIKLDVYSRIFQSMHSTKQGIEPARSKKKKSICDPPADIIYLSDGTLFNNRSKTSPVLFHFNGGSKVLHLLYDSQTWFRRPDANTPEALAAIRVKELITSKGKIAFQTICFNYSSAMKQLAQF